MSGLAKPLLLIIRCMLVSPKKPCVNKYMHDGTGEMGVTEESLKVNGGQDSTNCPNQLYG